VKVAFTTQNFLKKLDDQMYIGTVNPTSKVYCKAIFGVVIAHNNPIAIYAKSLIATAGNYIAQEYLDVPSIFPTTYEEHMRDDVSLDHEMDVHFPDDDLFNE
jgi:hypothetical protein